MPSWTQHRVSYVRLIGKQVNLASGSLGKSMHLLACLSESWVIAYRMMGIGNTVGYLAGLWLRQLLKVTLNCLSLSSLCGVTGLSFLPVNEDR